MREIPGIKIEMIRVFAGIGIGERTSVRIRVRRDINVPELEVFGLGEPDEDGVPVAIYRQR